MGSGWAVDGQLKMRSGRKGLEGEERGKKGVGELKRGTCASGATVCGGAGVGVGVSVGVVQW